MKRKFQLLSEDGKVLHEGVSEDPIEELQKLKRKTFGNTTDKEFKKSPLREFIKGLMNGGGKIVVSIFNDENLNEKSKLTLAYESFCKEVSKLNLSLRAGSDMVVMEGPIYRTAPRLLTENEFADRLLTNDNFNKKWSMGCTRDLSINERGALLSEKIGAPALPGLKMVSKTGTDEETHKQLDELYITKRTLID